MQSGIDIVDFTVCGTIDYTLGESITVVRFSPDFKYMAFGDSGGNLEIIRSSSGNWRRTRLYRAEATINAIQWHPTIPRFLVVGSVDGVIHHVKIDGRPQGLRDKCESFKVSGFINDLAINAKGSQLAVISGGRIALVNDPFNDDKRAIHAVPAQGDLSEEEMAHCHLPLPQQLFFLNDEGACSLVACSASSIAGFTTNRPSKRIWEIKCREGASIERAAISPQGDLIATTNIIGSVDWYCIRQKRLMGTTRHSIGARRFNHPVDIVFLDKSTIVAGHNRGQVVIASCVVSPESGQMHVGGGSRLEPAAQHVECAFAGNTLFTIIVKGEDLDTKIWVAHSSKRTTTPRRDQVVVKKSLVQVKACLVECKEEPDKFKFHVALIVSIVVLAILFTKWARFQIGFPEETFHECQHQ